MNIDKKERMKSIITLVCAGIIVVALLISFVLKAYYKQVSNVVADIKDDCMLVYEENAYIAESISYLFRIYDSSSYEIAKKNLYCSEELYKEIFTKEEWGKVSLYNRPPTVDVMSLQYVINLSEDNINNNSNAIDYLVELEVVNNDTNVTTYHTCAVTVLDGCIEDFDIY